MYLVDTNIWLERLLDQERSQEVGQFLDCTLSERLFITDFAFHSIGIVLSKLGQNGALLEFVRDVFIEGNVSLIHLEPGAVHGITSVMEQFGLDFDDAYQYVAADEHGLALVSLDSDFDRTEHGRKRLDEVLLG
jgi:uncharacterized protein